MKRSLPEIAIGRPVTVTMLVITVVGIGLIASQRIMIEFMPPMEFPFMGVYVPYPGATPAQVEQEIAIPAEGEFRTLPSLEEIYSNSDGDGCWISFQFDWGTDMNVALADIRDRIERLRLELPEDANEIYIRRFNSDAMPIMQIGMTGPGSSTEFAHLVDTVVQPRIQRLDGVADVQVWGYDQGSLMIDIDQHAMLAQNVSMYELIQTLNTADVDLSLGEIEDNERNYYIRAKSRIRTIPEYARLPIGQNGIRLSDLASGSFRSREREWERSLDGKRQLFVIVTKESEANTVATCAAVQQELDKIFASPEFEGAKTLVFFNQGEMILESLNQLKLAGVFGGALALTVLFFFLGRIRPTLLVGTAIPGSLVVAFVVMYFMDMSLNMISMMSMIIALGMVVDNSIVVIENIYRYKALGYDPPEAATRGANEVALAITAATCTTAVVFLPVFYMNEGQMSIFMRQFAVPVTVALFGSLLIALTVIPMVTSRFKKVDKSVGARLAGGLTRIVPTRSRGSLQRFFGYLAVVHPRVWLQPMYLAMLRGGIKWRTVSLLVLGGIVWVTYAVPFKQLGMQAMPTEDRREVEIDVRLDANYDMAAATEVFDLLEEAVNARREELGIKHVFKSHSARRGELEVQLYTPEDNMPMPYTTEEVMNILWYTLGTDFPGGSLRFEIGETAMGGSGGGRGRLSMQLMGDDMITLDRYADGLIEMMKDVPGLTQVRKSTERADQEIRVKIDNVLADHAGISPTRIAQTLGFALRGTRLSETISRGREIEVWAQYQEADRQSESNLGNVVLQGDSGQMVSLNRLVNLEKGETPQQIRRRNGKSFIWVSAYVDDKQMAQAQESLKQIADNLQLPTGYQVSTGDEMREMEQNMNNFTSSLFLAVILIYIVMAALFESLLLPLSIITSIALSGIGVVWFMFITDTPMDVVAFIGCILMVGVVVNNGIVIVDYINTLRRRGHDRFDAVITAGRDRLRPVLMTAITTIIGALPLALGGQWGEDAIVGLGRAMIGGLTAGTFLTLFVVPLFYTLIDDLQSWLGKYFLNVVRLRDTAAT